MYTAQQFEHIFENSSYIVEQVFERAQYTDAETLFQAFVNEVQQLTEAQQVALLQAHPSLGANIQMTNHSVAEQQQAGLKQLTQEQYTNFQRVNKAYEETFGFPFIVAVKGKSADTIYALMQQRLTNTRQAEFAEALAQVIQIARFRFDDIVGVSV
ncbi:2-oxo-4-hydroxy-4-carboxy-5-ureidoimidazoline decarboxylase [Caryophanon tenue]|uniref:2-oxo-4-hydroxy-4-carboxy-5-ureidoimidazoline decarboxylase n=1 Tax=Caryophanon tenue TaxID=33978 RepID=A0A1C0YEM6_9BACL|nr:2-oxo-4-hydroxy-4-carboxy-5-ureidoimidazoline decarboxylase [Caryophanon tenue]OCS85610.1 OHCU decarboxylase [Caryophanon tenue]